MKTNQLELVRFSFKKIQKIVDNFFKSDRLVSFMILGGKVRDE
ncbi:MULTISPECIES: hypothetical protein [Streptococcus]|nr:MULTISPECIES: hypothetical protein [Streptococcus]